MTSLKIIVRNVNGVFGFTIVLLILRQSIMGALTVTMYLIVVVIMFEMDVVYIFDVKKRKSEASFYVSTATYDAGRSKVQNGNKL